VIGFNRRKPKIALCMTTFLRDKLLYNNTKSILNNWRDNFVLLIADQGYDIFSKETKDTKDKEWIEDKKEFIEEIKAHKNVFYYTIPFDSGLSYGRNFLVEKAKELKCKYSMIISDSFEFNESINKIDELTELLSILKDVAIIGLHLNDRIEWTWNIEKTEDKFILTKPENTTSTYKSCSFIKCDKINNFFLAKTNILYKVKWDNELKLFEHLDFFWRLKNSQGANKVLFTKDITAKYIKFKPTIYNNYRKRMYSEFRNKVIAKYNLKTYGDYIT